VVPKIYKINYQVIINHLRGAFLVNDESVLHPFGLYVQNWIPIQDLELILISKWVFIANSFKTEEDFEILQAVDFEICQIDEKHECSVDGVSVRHTCKKCLLLSSFIFNLSDCKQNRMEVKLISYHPDTEEVVLHTFLIPSSCACYKKTYY
jgi:hypothetical protein